MVSTAKVRMLKLVPKLKTSKSSRLLLVDMKLNSCILMRLGMTSTKQAEMSYFCCFQSS